VRSLSLLASRTRILDLLAGHHLSRRRDAASTVSSRGAAQGQLWDGDSASMPSPVAGGAEQQPAGHQVGTLVLCASSVGVGVQAARQPAGQIE
jgi:hypothetical protein